MKQSQENKILKVNKESESQFTPILGDFSIIAGPCSVENTKDLETVAKSIERMGTKYIRGGTYKARTSPYSFQGMGRDGLKILKYVAQKYNLKSVSEIVDPRHLESMIDFVDILQIGSRNMQNFELLKEIGGSKHPVILKRGFCSTIQEFIFAAEYIAVEGNQNIILCERGIRTFETETRNTLDIACIPIIKNQTKLQIIADLTHSLGKRKDIIADVAKAVIAVGADGIMVEVHPDPASALSDSSQQLTIPEFEAFVSAIS